MYDRKMSFFPKKKDKYLLIESTQGGERGKKDKMLKEREQKKEVCIRLVGLTLAMYLIGWTQLNLVTEQIQLSVLSEITKPHASCTIQHHMEAFTNSIEH